MKNRFSFFLALIIGMNAKAVAQDWHVIEFPSYDHITGIDMLSPDTGYVITASGYCFRTFDRGKTWDKFEVIKNVRLESVSFLDASNGWVCGHKGSIYHTSDGGYTWGDQSLKDYEIVFFDILMTGGSTGIAVGMHPQKSNRLNSISVRTTDAGKNWKPLEPMGLAYSEIRYQEVNDKLFILALGKLSISSDGGQKWQSYTTIEGAPARTFSISGGTGIMAGPKGVCAYSSDSGKTWINNPLQSNQMFLSSILLDEQVGYIAGTNGEMMKTSDGGREWQEEKLPVQFTAMAMCYVDEYLFVSGSDGIIIVKNVE